MALPAISQASPRLPLSSLDQGTPQRLGLSMMDRVLSTALPEGELAQSRKPVLHLKALNQRQEVPFSSVTVGHQVGEENSPAWRADPSNAPAGTVHRGPSGFHAMIVSLPTMHF